MLISRQVGTVSSLVTVFLPDRTVSTGAGLANIVASTVRISWLRSDQAAVSSWTLTTGTLGTWASSTMTQLGSTSTLGAYQFSLPHGLFVSGDTAYVHIMSSTATFAEVPILIELTKTDNQTYLSSQTVGFVRNNVSVSTITTPVSASSVTAPVGVSTLPAITSMTVGVNVTSIHGSAAVTSAAGVFGPLAVSSVTTPVSVTSGVVRASSATVTSLTVEALQDFFDVGVTTFTGAVVSSVVYEIAKNATVSLANIPLGVSSIATPVTVSAGVVRASSATVTSLTVEALLDFFDVGVTTFAGAVVSSVVYEIATNASAVVGDVNVSSFTAGALNQFFTTDAGDYSTSVLGSVVQEIADNVSATVGAQVGVSSISIPVSVSSVTAAVNVSAFHGSAAVTSAAGVLGPVSVSTVSTPVTASSVTAAVNVSSIYGSAAVTSAAGVWGPLAVSSVTTPVTASSVTRLVGVSTVTIPVGVSTGSIAVSSATAGVNEAIADATLNRNIAGGSNTGRLVKEGLYVLRNKVDAGLGIVYETDDTTSSWAFTVSTVPGDPIQVIDPAG